ncbi:hypothetical protein VIGAN_01397700 [Vigna angularis var. angularis]|uniref:Exopolyphosphatase n=2 Tax=Phaseolus angularis TaxID=3914 RepID=A0A0S3R5V2_PHAAN|nr:uncharacterized protein LOC108329308 [Vigna angularis]BAT76024.1 hypothetical protein VIGAN_01397700 [Vigna angularis var. angularis]
MDRRSSRQSKGSLSLQKKMAETRRKEKPAPDLTDFMNDMFFGAVDHVDNKTYDLTGSKGVNVDEEEEDDEGFDDSTRSNSARLTQEWLQEARLIVGSSPSRGGSPSRLSGSPRFAAPQPPSPLSSLDHRDSLSRTRSARRYRTGVGISDEILSKTARHTRNKSDTFAQPSSDEDGSPATAVHNWFSNILKPTNNNNTQHTTPSPPDNTLLTSLPPRQPHPRKSRFQTEPSAAPHPQGIQTPNSRRTFKTSAPENSPSDSVPLSPPRNLVESAHRRTILSSTCSRERMAPRHVAAKGEQACLNGFLKEQRTLLHKISTGESHANVQIVLSGPSNGTASMVAAICHAWLLDYRQKEKEGGMVVVPVMNVKRGSMWKLKQAAWLFHHAGLDATSLLFIDEVDMESLLMTGQLSVLVVGQDVLSTTGEVGSQCTVVTDNYCEDAYDLLENPVLKKLLLAGILLDTQNLKSSAAISMTRDAEAVQLLLAGSVPNYRYALFDQLIQDQGTASFIEALNHSYGKSPTECEENSEGKTKNKVRERKSSSVSDREPTISSSKTNSSDTRSSKAFKVSPNPVKLVTPPLLSPSPAPTPQHAEKEAPRGKNKFFLARWFGFGSK